MILINDEIRSLADRYQQRGVFGLAASADALHVATGTVAGADVVASWGFQHMVKLRTTQRVNAANLDLGYRPVEVHTGLDDPGGPAIAVYDLADRRQVETEDVLAVPVDLSDRILDRVVSRGASVEESPPVPVESREVQVLDLIDHRPHRWIQKHQVWPVAIQVRLEIYLPLRRQVLIQKPGQEADPPLQLDAIPKKL